MSTEDIEDRDLQRSTIGWYRIEFCPDGFQTRAASRSPDAPRTTASLAAAF
ncbi:hypothetical protein [Halorubrum halophilum]|uniref:hypothetical protein n=1 Tax=Halorubrum halophilum TaxID=413816 RepID=UPI000AE5A1C8|nr:hypothetical protein [Halorubrum halophilum]